MTEQLVVMFPLPGVVFCLVWVYLLAIEGLHDFNLVSLLLFQHLANTSLFPTRLAFILRSKYGWHDESRFRPWAWPSFASMPGADEFVQAHGACTLQSRIIATLLNFIYKRISHITRNILWSLFWKEWQQQICYLAWCILSIHPCNTPLYT